MNMTHWTVPQVAFEWKGAPRKGALTAVLKTGFLTANIFMVDRRYGAPIGLIASGHASPESILGLPDWGNQHFGPDLCDRTRPSPVLSTFYYSSATNIPQSSPHFLVKVSNVTIVKDATWKHPQPMAAPLLHECKRKEWHDYDGNAANAATTCCHNY